MSKSLNTLIWSNLTFWSIKYNISNISILFSFSRFNFIIIHSVITIIYYHFVNIAFVRNYLIIKSHIFYIFVSILFEYFTNSFKHYAKQTIRTLKYLTHIKYYVIVYKNQTNHAIIIFLNILNTLFANDLNICQNSNEYYFMFFWRFCRLKNHKTKNDYYQFNRNRIIDYVNDCQHQNIIKSFFWFNKNKYKKIYVYRMR